MEDQKLLDLTSGKRALIRTRITMRDKLKIGAVASKLVDAGLDANNKVVIKADLAQKYLLDEALLTTFGLSFDGKAIDIDELDIVDGEEIIEAIWEANGERMGLDRANVFSLPQRAAAVPKVNAKN